MRTTLLWTAALAMWLGTTVAVIGQENQNSEDRFSPEKIARLKESVVEEEKAALRDEVEAINQRLEDGLITTEEAEKLKKNAATLRAQNIDNRLAIIDNQKELYERNEVEADSVDNGYVIIDFGTDKSDSEMLFGLKIKSGKKKPPFDRRTTTGFNLAVGLNNVVTKGESFNHSQFETGGSRFFELGWTAKTRVFNNSNWLRVKYGLAFQFNGLKPVDNQYFVTSGNETVLEEFPHRLKKVKFRMDNLVAPIHFEFGPSRKSVSKDTYRYLTWNKPAFGLGGYAGVNLGTRQKLKYRDDGRRQKDKLKNNYNSSNLIYGVSGYVLWRDFGLYAKYDLNSIFTDNPVKQRNISVGVRWDMN